MSDAQWHFDILREGFKDGYVTKDEYAYALRENQVACNEIHSLLFPG